VNFHFNLAREARARVKIASISARMSMGEKARTELSEPGRTVGAAGRPTVFHEHTSHNVLVDLDTKPFFWNGIDLHRKLDRFAIYYDQRRVHAGLSGRTPFEQCGTTASQPANLNHYAWRSDCSGLFHTPIAA
jgi:hypothetical protein